MIAVVLAYAAWSTAWIFGQDSLHQTSPPPHTAVKDEALTFLQQPVLGMALNMHHVGDLDRYLHSIDQIAAMGANALVIVTPWFQEKINSNNIEFVATRCPTAAQLKSVLQRAKQHQLRTALVPIVLIAQPEPKEWRGKLAPSDWLQWWSSYTRFISHFVEIADEMEVDIFSIGSELNSTENQVERWASLTTLVRNQFSGAITYTANWDRYEKIGFWGLVDFISISAYFELVDESDDATVAAMSRTWSQIAQNLKEFAKQQKRLLLLMEVGYASVPWAGARPWDYLPGDLQSADPNAQSHAYQAFLNTWTTALATPSCPVRGFFLYHWDPYHHGGIRDFGYGIEGKPAEKLIRNAFKRIRVLLEQSSAASNSVAN